MKENEKILFNHFKSIARKGWIEGTSKCIKSVGLTFERELGKPPDSKCYPDYEGIELKCTQRYSHYPIGLFQVAFDGPSTDETNYILKKYGITDRYRKNTITLETDIEVNKGTIVYNKYIFQLKINRDEKRLYLKVLDLNMNVIDHTSYISFTNIRKKFKAKLPQLAVITASKKENNKVNCYRYYKINLYKSKTFPTFLKLLENDTIKVKIICNCTTNANETTNRNKGIMFYIPKDKINLLFTETFTYDHDEELSKIKSI